MKQGQARRDEGTPAGSCLPLPSPWLTIWTHFSPGFLSSGAQPALQQTHAAPLTHVYCGSASAWLSGGRTQTEQSLPPEMCSCISEGQRELFPAPVLSSGRKVQGIIPKPVLFLPHRWSNTSNLRTPIFVPHSAVMVTQWKASLVLFSLYGMLSNQLPVPYRHPSSQVFFIFSFPPIAFLSLLLYLSLLFPSPLSLLPLHIIENLFRFYF